MDSFVLFLFYRHEQLVRIHIVDIGRTFQRKGEKIDE